MFYHYHQNNSGGSFRVRPAEGIGVNVIVEAENPAAADERAEEIGLYFGGLTDCPCCGNRWRPASDDDGRDVPHLYGGALKENYPQYEDPNTAYIHYLDGRIEVVN